MKPNEKILVLACGALAREIIALKSIHGWEHLDLHCLPAKLHLFPKDIPDAVRKSVTEHRGNYDQIYLAYADCGTGGMLQKTADELGIEMIAGPHCYSFFDGNDTFAERGDEEMFSFYLTDFLARHFDTFIWQPMGFDKHPELIEMMFGNYKSLIYLAQTDDPALDARAEECARLLNLEYIRRFTGYGDLGKVLGALSTK